MSAVASPVMPQPLPLDGIPSSLGVGSSGTSRCPEDLQRNSVITEEDLDLTVDFDSDVEDSLGPDFWSEKDKIGFLQECIEALGYADNPTEFWEYYNDAYRTLGYPDRFHLNHDLGKYGIKKWLKKYVIEKKIPVRKLLFAFGVLLTREQLRQDNLSLLPVLKAALFRRMRQRDLQMMEWVPHAHYILPNVVEQIHRATNIVVLTGAGISVSCGIPDFRSRNGLYSQIFSTGAYDLDDPQQMFDINYFKHNPSVFYSFAHKIYPSNFIPSPCHRFIRAIENHGKLLRNYTQNIDTLETKAGIKRVLQCHGSFATATCINCHVKVPGDIIKDDLLAQRVPLCKACNSEAELKPKKTRRKKKKKKRNDGWESDEPEETTPLPAGIMKPDITFFGEKLSKTFDKKVFQDIKSVDLVLVIGTSLRVRPVSEIITHMPHNIPIVVINKTPMTHFKPDYQLLGDADVIVKYLAHNLRWNLRSKQEGAPLDKSLSSERLSHLPKEKRKGDKKQIRVLGRSRVVLFKGAEGGKFAEGLATGNATDTDWSGPSSESEDADSEADASAGEADSRVHKRRRRMVALQRDS